MTASTDPRALYDYIVVGSGAGGGPLAARLAEAGMRVLLLEAGAEGACEPDSDKYAVPAFNGLATEDPATRWQFFVRHYADLKQQERDKKYVADQDGVFYPRAATLGGCTAHNAMITVYPHAQDWDGIAELTGDQSWAAENMRAYFERLEDCGYRRRPWRRPSNPVLAALVTHLPLVSGRFKNHARHGFGGWLHTSLADPLLAVGDEEIVGILLDALVANLEEFLGRPLTALEDLRDWADPNDWRVRDRLEGLWQIPMAVRDGRRNGSRERIRDVARRFPDRLEVRTGCLVTRVLLDEQPAATGVEYIDTPHAYRCDPHPAGGAMPPAQQAHASREVVLAGGAFNTPQLLKLSGIGPREELEGFDIPVRLDLPGVGLNLQDRYEVTCVSRMTRDFPRLRGARFQPPEPGENDPAFREWQSGKGIYATNGALVGIIRRSRRELESPDLFVFGLPARFDGYYPGFSKNLTPLRDYFTWAVLKAHTVNRAGEVRLHSADPRERPAVVFHYFDEGTDAEGADIDAVVDGVQIARDVMRRAGDLVAEEISPGPSVQTRDEVRDWVRDQAWGHHASCTCRMGREGDRLAVTDSRFRVQGVGRLRIVDASVFPCIPGFFIVTAVYMLAEKASDVILQDARP
ncbi:GMC family oxidoreductase [Mycobacterium sp.]|uniref:GMC family oxidoreductase n=1 Tax=Mycobacterium sp. TaxID=1785 RepID=UPI003F946887